MWIRSIFGMAILWLIYTKAILTQTVKVQTPLARLRHCGDTSGPLQGQRVHSRGQDKMSKQTRVDCEKEEEE